MRRHRVAPATTSASFVLTHLPAEYADDVDLAGGDVDEEQHVDPLEQHRVNGEEIARQHGVRLRGQETVSTLARPRRCAGSMPALLRIFQTVLAATW
jgi:hypothetical protein